MIIFPNAKINLGLNVISRREDGYHNIETILYPIKIQDAVEIIEADEMLFTSSGIKIPGNPEANLCLKAWYLMSEDIDLPKVHIHLHKQIPVGAGLGGGSADGAFCIRLLNEKFDLSLTAEKMEDYSRRLGSDCAFFIKNQPVVARGKGDEFERIDLSLESYFVVLVMPSVHVNTAEAYQSIRPKVSGSVLEDLAGLSVERWKDVLVNDFEFPVFKSHPLISEIKDELYRKGALYASMSGSGASVYGIFKDQIRMPDLERENFVFYGI
ncbi:MAG TPA: 4-(cytidine 5'-diphospho)-2-C-methyl-D-erythritol kinase [Daejeonella sp.]|nr:4-(cytidine 5'-diphospho)-2-C-methyl-D-erythritol kinase [Daejeonella sp.]